MYQTPKFGPRNNIGNISTRDTRSSPIVRFVFAFRLRGSFVRTKG